tara:strand:+ start:984 stop:1871 length:888 start_codon:yes stop_codon:yes gene_type:complete
LIWGIKIVPYQTFFVLCRIDSEIAVKRLSVDAAVQVLLGQMFETQELEFLENTEDLIEFDGGWKPDEGEALTVSIPLQTDLLINAVLNPLACDILQIEGFSEENVRAIFSGRIENGNAVVAIQKFSSQQILEHKITLFQNNNVLNRLTSPAFTLDNKLVGLLQGQTLIFKSFHNIRMIFDLSDLYRAATDQDIDAFAAHHCLTISNIAEFKTEVDQVSRKLIHAIQRNGVLDDHTAQEILRRAELVGIDVNITEGRVVMPSEKAAIKRILRFLHDDIYEAPLSRQRYVSNSKRRV